MTGDPWLGANPLDPAFRDDPYPALKRLREIDLVNRTPVGIWRLTRYDDCLRFDGPIPVTQRIPHEDVTFGEKSIPRDGSVLVMLAAANRDPERFPRLALGSETVEWGPSLFRVPGRLPVTIGS